MNRSWKIALVASLVLNVFLLGGIAGGAWQWFANRSHAAQSAQTDAQQHALRFAAQDLSAERQQQFAAALKEARRDGRPFTRDGRDARHDVLRLLAAPQLDRAALDAALAHTRDADNALRARVEQGVANFAATLSPDERAQFAQSLTQRGQWRLPAQPRAASQAAGQGKPASQQN
ncbi:periplasmic heavy metal sensor [Paraburkholderia jirisanensis]